MEYLALAFVVIVIFVIAINSSNRDKPRVILSPGVFKIDDVKYNAKYEALGETLKKLIKEGKTSTDEPNHRAICGELLNIKDDEWTNDFLSSMNMVLIDRCYYAKLDDLKERRERYNSEINVKNGESVLFKNKSMSLFTVQKLFTEVSYGIARTASGVFRAGAGTIKSNQVEGLKMKSNGTVYLTNKRIIYIGENNDTTVLNYSQIVDAIMYEDDGILLRIANTHPIVLNFNANLTYDSNNAIFNDSRLEAFNVIDSLIH